MSDRWAVGVAVYHRIISIFTDESSTYDGPQDPGQLSGNRRPDNSGDKHDWNQEMDVKQVSQPDSFLVKDVL